jgi:hypothetical protein
LVLLSFYWEIFMTTAIITIGELTSAIGSLIYEATSAIPLMTGPNPLTPIQALGGAELATSTVGASVTVLRQFVGPITTLPPSVGVAGAVANAASVSIGIVKLTDAFLKYDNDQAIDGILDIIAGSAGLLGMFPVYTPAAVLVQSAALLAKTWVRNNPGEINKAMDKIIDAWESLDITGFIADLANTLYTTARNWRPPHDPLVLDLDGDGIETVGITAGAPVLFDHDGDGIKNATGWIKADDGLLVLDLNGNGTIDSGRELFGDNTLLPSGSTALQGYQALAQHDSNLDGRISSLDTLLNQLRIWQDANQDGISQSTELKTLSQAGIQSISVPPQQSTNPNLGNGNSMPIQGSYTKTDGSSGLSGGVELTGACARKRMSKGTRARIHTQQADTHTYARLAPQRDTHVDNY